jgi:hypothetical protein
VPRVSFSTIVQPDPDGVLLVEVPAHVMAALSEKKRIPVNVTLNGREVLLAKPAAHAKQVR